MQIQINYSDIEKSPALSQHVEEQVEKALKHVSERVTRVEVHLHNDKQKRDGPQDKRSLMEARIAGDQPLAIESRSDDIYKAVKESAEKLGRAVNHRIDKHDDA